MAALDELHRVDEVLRDRVPLDESCLVWIDEAGDLVLQPRRQHLRDDLQGAILQADWAVVPRRFVKETATASYDSTNRFNVATTAAFVTDVHHVHAFAGKGAQKKRDIFVNRTGGYYKGWAYYKAQGLVTHDTKHVR